MREGTDLLVPEQPGDLGNRQILVGQIAFREIHFKVFQDGRETQLLRREAASERSLTDAKPARDFVSSGLAMRQQGNDRIFDPRTERATSLRSALQCFFAVADQYSVEVMIGA